MKIYICELCGRQFKKKSNLVDHLNRKYKCVNPEVTYYTIKDIVNNDNSPIKNVKKLDINNNEMPNNAETQNEVNNQNNNEIPDNAEISNDIKKPNNAEQQNNNAETEDNKAETENKKAEIEDKKAENQNITELEPINEPIKQQNIEPVIEYKKEVITEPVIEPVLDQNSSIILEPVIEPVTEPIIEPVIEPVTELVTEPDIEPVNEPELFEPKPKIIFKNEKIELKNGINIILPTEKKELPKKAKNKTIDNQIIKGIKKIETDHQSNNKIIILNDTDPTQVFNEEDINHNNNAPLEPTDPMISDKNFTMGEFYKAKSYIKDLSNRKTTEKIYRIKSKEDAKKLLQQRLLKNKGIIIKPEPIKRNKTAKVLNIKKI